MKQPGDLISAFLASSENGAVHVHQTHGGMWVGIESGCAICELLWVRTLREELPWSELSPRTEKALLTHRIKTFRQLVQRTLPELKRLRSFGPVTIKELQRLLEGNGLSFGMRP